MTYKKKAKVFGKVLSTVTNVFPHLITAKRMKIFTAVVSLVALIITPSVASYARGGSETPTSTVVGRV